MEAITTNGHGLVEGMVVNEDGDEEDDLGRLTAIAEDAAISAARRGLLRFARNDSINWAGGRATLRVARPSFAEAGAAGGFGAVEEEATTDDTGRFDAKVLGLMWQHCGGDGVIA